MLMSVSRRAALGFTLIELAVTLTLAGLLLALGFPSFTAWIRNSQVRAVADALQSGIRRAQTDAVRLNQTMVLSFTNAQPGLNAAAVANGRNWSIQTIEQFDRPAVFMTGGALADVASSVQIVSNGATAMCFNASGRLVALAAAATGVPGAACVAGAQRFDIQNIGSDRPLRVLVAVGGQTRMCDPNRPALSATSPDGCPP